MKNRKNNVFEHFKSIESLLNTMEERPTNEAFLDKKNLSSQEIDEGLWSGTRTYKEAMHIMKTGYKEPLEQMKKAILKIGEKEQHTRPKTQNDFVGFVPHVPNTLMNLPITMINRERQPLKSKTIHLIYSVGVSSNVKTHDLIKGGINFISLVNSLQKQGYRVKIDISATFVTTQTLASVSINLKEYGQNLNLLKLAFPLVHPSMLRRIMFKWLETTPKLTDKSYTSGYGYPLAVESKKDSAVEAEYMRKKGFIKGEYSYYLSAYDAIKAKTIEDLATMTGITK